MVACLLNEVKLEWILIRSDKQLFVVLLCARIITFAVKGTINSLLHLHLEYKFISPQCVNSSSRHLASRCELRPQIWTGGWTWTTWSLPQLIKVDLFVNSSYSNKSINFTV